MVMDSDSSAEVLVLLGTKMVTPAISWFTNHANVSTIESES